MCPPQFDLHKNVPPMISQVNRVPLIAEKYLKNQELNKQTKWYMMIMILYYRLEIPKKIAGLCSWRYFRARAMSKPEFQLTHGILYIMAVS